VYDDTLEAVEARIQKALPAKFRFVRSLYTAQPAIVRSDEGQIEKARRAREEAEQREREQRLQAAKDRVTRLLAQVSARQQAQQIGAAAGCAGDCAVVEPSQAAVAMAIGRVRLNWHGAGAPRHPITLPTCN
jgi:hypothetical protein